MGFDQKYLLADPNEDNNHGSVQSPADDNGGKGDIFLVNEQVWLLNLINPMLAQSILCKTASYSESQAQIAFK